MSVQRFESIHHPGSLPRAAVYSRALIRPLAACMLPVMVGTLVAVLEGLPVLPYAFWAGAAAVMVASVWSSFNLRRRLAEIRVSGPWVQIRSVADVVAHRAAAPRRVLDVRDYGSWADLTIGLTSYEIERRAWPAFDEIVDALAASRGR